VGDDGGMGTDEVTLGRGFQVGESGTAGLRILKKVGRLQIPPGNLD